MKKLIPLLLALLMLAGCATPGAETGTTTTKASATQQATTTSAPETTAAPETKLSRGSWAGNVFTNASIGLTFTMPEGWFYASDADIAALMGMGADLMAEGGMDITDSMDDVEAYYDAMIQDGTTGSNVVIMFQSLEVAYGGSSVDVSSLSESYFLNAIGQQMSQLTNMDYVVDTTISERSISGNTFYEMSVSSASMGFTQIYSIRKLDGYLICLIFTVADPAMADVMFDCFS